MKLLYPRFSPEFLKAMVHSDSRNADSRNARPSALSASRFGVKELRPTNECFGHRLPFRTLGNRQFQVAIEISEEDFKQVMALVWIAAVCKVQISHSILVPRPRGLSLALHQTTQNRFFQ